MLPVAPCCTLASAAQVRTQQPAAPDMRRSWPRWRTLEAPPGVTRSHPLPPQTPPRPHNGDWLGPNSSACTLPHARARCCFGRDDIRGGAKVLTDLADKPAAPTAHGLHTLSIPSQAVPDG